MDYQKMKVAELRELARERGIDASGMKKADIVAALTASDEPIEVEADVIENKLAISSKSLSIDAGSLVSKIEEITEAIDNMAEVTGEMDASADVIAGMELSDVAVCKKALNDAIKDVEERRLEFGRILREPINLVNDRCKELTESAKELRARYKSREDAAEEERRLDKKDELRGHYEAFAGVLLDVVPFEKVFRDEWLLKGYSVQTAKEDIEDALRKVSEDWESLKNLNLELHEDAEARFFDTLDLGDAIAWAGKLADDKRRIEAMKAELAPAAEPDAEPVAGRAPEGACGPATDAPPYEGGRAEPQPAPQQVPMQPVPAQPLQAGEMERDRVIAGITAILKGYRLDLLRNLLDALEAAQDTTGEASQRVMVIDAATQGQLAVIGKFCGLAGVTGTFKPGTLAEVVDRENRKVAQRAGQGVYGYGA